MSKQPDPAEVFKSLTPAQLRDLCELVAFEREHPTWTIPDPGRTSRGLVAAGCLARPAADFARSNVLITPLGRAVSRLAS